MPYGYAGRILHVDLDEGSLEEETPDDAFYRKYLGGSALGMHYVLNKMPAGADPCSPENTLVLAVGVLTGCPISGQSRLTATAKSPLTGAIGDAQSGGFFPAEMKFAGFDAVVVQGKSEKPVYLWLHDGEAELRSAGHLWGKVTAEAEAIIRQDLGDERIEVIQIGPAGELGVRFASLMNMSNRANGRTGMGAVMGSKKLKAVAVRGTHKPEMADQAALIDLARWGAENFEGSDISGLRLSGTAGILPSLNKGGGLPTRNWSSGTFEGADAISGPTMSDTILKHDDTCYACTVRCKRGVEITEGPFVVDPHYGGPEYETLATFGSYCGVDDLAAIAYANQLCNMYGMDTISCGATIAWAMDCYEHGILTKDDTGGLELNFGNADAMVKLTEMIAKREGLGNLLAEGSARAAATLGNGAEDLVVTAKKQEYPAHMPQSKRSLALIYSVNPFGADHESHQHDPSYAAYPERMAEIGLTNADQAEGLNKEVVCYALTGQWAYSCMDSLNVCQFLYGPAWQLYSMGQLRDALRAVTGWDVTVDELLRVGERRLNMMRAFNALAGFDRDDDVLPKKLTQPLKGGATDGSFVTVDEVEKAKDLYYELAGWDIATGTPKREKLEELGLGWVADQLSGSAASILTRRPNETG
jgi:aldehyde:ferredoxin oxidoreductase